MYSKMKILCIYSCLYDMKIFARILPPHRLSFTSLLYGNTYLIGMGEADGFIIDG